MENPVWWECCCCCSCWSHRYTHTHILTGEWDARQTFIHTNSVSTNREMVQYHKHNLSSSHSRLMAASVLWMSSTHPAWGGRLCKEDLVKKTLWALCEPKASRGESMWYSRIITCCIITVYWFIFVACSENLSDPPCIFTLCTATGKERGCCDWPWLLPVPKHQLTQIMLIISLQNLYYLIPNPPKLGIQHSSHSKVEHILSLVLGILNTDALT